VSNISIEDIALIGRNTGNIYNRRGKGGKTKIHNKPVKKKGGYQPIDQIVVEMLEDLRKEIKRRYPSMERVTPLYLQLKALLNY